MTSNNCWIFSIKNPKNTPPLTFRIKPDKQCLAIYQSDKSPILGSTNSFMEDLYLE